MRSNKQVRAMIESLTGCEYFNIYENPPHWSSKHQVGFTLRDYRGKPISITRAMLIKANETK